MIQFDVLVCLKKEGFNSIPDVITSNDWQIDEGLGRGKTAPWLVVLEARTPG